MLKEENPDAELVVHPECDPELQLKANYVGSTGQMLRHCGQSGSERFIIATEIGLIDRLRRELPGKTYLPAVEDAICHQMKLHTLEKVYQALKREQPVVRVPRKTADKARVGIERMLKLSR